MISPGAKVRYAAHFGLSADIGVRADRLSKYMMKMYIEGEKDEHRLTVHGLSYLRRIDQEIASRD